MHIARATSDAARSSWRLGAVSQTRSSPSAGSAGPVAVTRRADLQRPRHPGRQRRSWRSTLRIARRTRRWCRSRCTTCCRPGTPAAWSQYHAGDRREPLAPGGRVLSGRVQRDAIAVDAGARRCLHQPACRGRTERRAPLCRAAVRQGGRRLLGACRKAGGRLDPARHHAVSPVSPGRRRRPGQERGAAHDPASQLFGHADGPADPPLRSRAFREVGAHLAGRGSAAVDRERHFDLPRTQVPLRLPPEWRGHLQSRDGGQRGQRRSSRSGPRRRPDGWSIQKQRTSASACASSRSRTIVVGGRAAELLRRDIRRRSGACAAPSPPARSCRTAAPRRSRRSRTSSAAAPPVCRRSWPCRQTRIRRAPPWRSRCCPPLGWPARTACRRVPIPHRAG